MAVGASAIMARPAAPSTLSEDTWQRFRRNRLALAGFAAGWIDVLIMRAVEILLAFPYLLLAIAVVSALGPGVLNTTIAVGIWGTSTVTRMVRGAVLAARASEYVSAARALGASATEVLRRHVLRNILPTVVVYSTLFMANAILVEAALSFLGLGVQPPTPSWGLMVSTGRDVLLVAPHVATMPGLAIVVSVLGFNLLGDGLRDADRKSTRLNSSHGYISYAVFCLKKKKTR